jgi:hypothetical protein
MGQLMQKHCAVFFRGYEEIARRHRHAIAHAAVESLRSCVVNLGRVRHSGDDPFGRFDRIMLVRFNFRQLVEARLLQFAFFEVEPAIISQKESAPILFMLSSVSRSSRLYFRCSTFQTITCFPRFSAHGRRVRLPGGSQSEGRQIF